jgi:DNA-binding MltR family transcriptional regulator
MRRLVPVEQLSEDTRKLFDVLNGESDLSCVIIGAAFLDTALATLLKRHLASSSITEKMLSPNGALGAFAVRADLAYCLGLISNYHYRDLCTIGKVRNHFAHDHLGLAFSEPEIRHLCDGLHQWRMLLHGDADDSPHGLTERQLATRARNQFNLSVVLLANRLLLTTLGLKHSNSA